jgi:dTDP-4-amino-4,6-dideoxygalactose transaminase
VATPQREALQAYLKANLVQTLIHYPVPPHLQHAYEGLHFARGSFPLAERYANEVLSLPMGPQLSMSDVDQVISHVRAFYGHDAA